MLLVDILSCLLNVQLIKTNFFLSTEPKLDFQLNSTTIDHCKLRLVINVDLMQQAG